MKRFIHFIIESEEYTLKDLKNDFKEFNKTLFKSELPQVKLTLSPNKKDGYSGWLKVVYNDKNNLDDFTIKDLMVSSIYKTDSIKGLLIHEMIHLYLAYNGFHEGINCELHGKEFNTKLREVQSKTDIKIPLNESDSNILKLKISDAINSEEPDWMKAILDQYR